MVSARQSADEADRRARGQAGAVGCEADGGDGRGQRGRDEVSAHSIVPAGSRLTWGSPGPTASVRLSDPECKKKKRVIACSAWVL
jgi:hypothetical protein